MLFHLMIKVLFVDDDPTILDVMKLTLEKGGGISVTTTLSAEEAIEILKTGRFDAIIADIHMSGMDGIQFLKYVRSHGIESSFIVFTGRGREDVAMEALNLGADFYLQKRGDPAILHTELRNMILQSVQRREVEANLRESEERYRTLAESSNDFIFIIDRDDTVLYVNSHGSRQFGMTPEEIVGKPRSVLFPSGADGTQKQSLDTVFRTGKPLMVEGSVVFPDKTAGWINTHLIPIRNEAGRVDSVMGISRDVSRYKEIEAGLKESEGRYRAVVETQEEFICRFRPDGTHLFVNPAYCDYFGLSCSQITGSKFKPGVPEEDWKTVRRHFSSLSRDHPAASILHRVVMPDGEVRWHSWNDRAFFDDKGEVTEYLSVGRDVTEIMRAEEAMNLANKKLGLLSSVTRHDIVNQVTVLNALLDLAGEEATRPTWEEHIMKVRKIAATIENQIGFTRQYEDIGLTAARWQKLEEIIRTGIGGCDMSGISVGIDLPPVEVFADPLLEKVYYNLADNAVRHGVHVTKISISAKKTRYGLIVFFEDDGVGIPPEHKERIFDSGFGRNSGFGLYLAREILDITGLSIIETGEPGKGAKFEVFIPKGKYRKNGPKPEQRS